MSVFGQTSGNKLWSPSKYSRLWSQHFVNVENPLPTMNLMYDGYESKVLKGFPSLGGETCRCFPNHRILFLFLWCARYVYQI